MGTVSVGAVYEAVNECQAGNSPPVSGGVWWCANFIHTSYDRPVFRFVDLREEVFGSLLIHGLEGIPQ
jgi:hypothetical protein